MKKFLFFLLIFYSFTSLGQVTLKGAWKLEMGDSETIFLATDTYLTYTMYSATNGQFTQTWGGNYIIKNDNLEVKIDFNSSDSTEVGSSKVLKIRMVGNFLKISTLTFHKVDEGVGTPLVGCWQISNRATQTGEMREIPDAPRKTIKLMSGTHYQWVAMNTETGQFFGTGGGTYAYDSGIYTEEIRFFSRDISRVGKSLTFNADVEANNWVHSGKSSTGSPIKEIWSKMN